ncbi:Scr1 family TA system antitoxin-like transcriptional regulator [Actinomadura adrarensis]|uniref:Scr1 family TA system antitoxin-like transcriptional regulator n=1 Tax=Actinomadura adrarensis TaxID=1819600 RepID=A0ABW3CTG6_9ACTN
MPSRKPSTTTTVTSGAALAYWGDELRYHREEAGLTQTELARRVFVSPSLIAMIETGRRAPKPQFIKATDTALDTGGALGRLWKRIIQSSYLEWFRPFVDVESDAETILEFSAQAVPGLLQTEQYARAQIRYGRPRDSDEQIERHVAARMSRQEILNPEKPPFLWVILDEAALRRPVGGPTVMREQFDWLVQKAASPDIILQVLPFLSGAHAGLSGPMILFSLPDDTRLAYAEGFGGGQLIGRPEEVEECRLCLDLLRADALPPEESVQLVAGMIGEP